MRSALNRSLLIGRAAGLTGAGLLLLAGSALAHGGGGGHGGFGHAAGSVHGGVSRVARGAYGHYGAYGYPHYGGYGYGHYGYFRAHGFGWGFGYSFYPYYGWYYPYSGYGYGGWGYGYYDPRGSLRLQVKPDQAHVYVDGYYVGIVDDFDGLFQRLHLPPGRHEIAFKSEGFKTHRAFVYAPSGHTVKLRYHMIPGTGEDAAEDLTGGAPATGGQWDRSLGEEGRPAAPDQTPSAAAGGAGTGELVLNVHPDDASVYVDDQFRGSGREIAHLRLPSGRHRVEVARPGFRALEREVRVEADGTTDLDLTMERSR